uniref:Uncharacterized protein n=1 Tax=Arundo donax TaxID=35708 RepID=A0A0A9HJT7_ARUDO
MTLSPRSRRRSTRWLPTKPAPPVTSTRRTFRFRPSGTLPPTKCRAATSRWAGSTENRASGLLLLLEE